MADGPKLRKRCSCDPKQWTRCPHAWGATYKVKTATGAWRTAWAGFPKLGKREAQAALAEKIREGHAGHEPPRQSETFGDYLRGWLDQCQRRVIAGDMSPTTVANYEHTITTYVLPRVGQVRMSRAAQELPAAIENCYIELRTSGGQCSVCAKTAGRSGNRVCHLPDHAKYRRPAGKATVALADRILRSALADARRLGRLTEDPMARVDKRSGPPPRRTCWDAATIGQFLTASTTVEDRCSAAWNLVLFKGFRRGDLAGLKWQESREKDQVAPSGVDLDRRIIYLDLQRTMAGGSVVEKPPKYRDADDPPTVVELGPHLWASMRAHRERMVREAAEQGRPLSPYVFCRPDGGPYQPQWFLRMFQRLAVLAGVPVMPIHSGRHSTATLASSLNINDSTTQQVMRHADRATTADYQHEVAGIQRVVEEEFVRAIFGPGGPAAA